MWLSSFLPVIRKPCQMSVWESRIDRENEFFCLTSCNMKTLSNVCVKAPDWLRKLDFLLVFLYYGSLVKWVRVKALKGWENGPSALLTTQQESTFWDTGPNSTVPPSTGRDLHVWVRGSTMSWIKYTRESFPFPVPFLVLSLCSFSSTIQYCAVVYFFFFPLFLFLIFSLFFFFLFYLSHAFCSHIKYCVSEHFYFVSLFPFFSSFSTFHFPLSFPPFLCIPLSLISCFLSFSLQYCELEYFSFISLFYFWLFSFLLFLIFFCLYSLSYSFFSFLSIYSAWWLWVFFFCFLFFFTFLFPSFPHFILLLLSLSHFYLSLYLYIWYCVFNILPSSFYYFFCFSFFFLFLPYLLPFPPFLLHLLCTSWLLFLFFSSIKYVCSSTFSFFLSSLFWPFLALFLQFSIVLMKFSSSFSPPTISYLIYFLSLSIVCLVFFLLFSVPFLTLPLAPLPPVLHSWLFLFSSYLFSSYFSLHLFLKTRNTRLRSEATKGCIVEWVIRCSYTV